jgi:hypothetical protein
VKLTDLDPRWLLKGGKHIGFIFRCPNPDRAKWRMACFAVPTPYDDQAAAVEAAIGADINWQPSNEACGWQIAGGIDAATFETMTVSPSIDGGIHMWHGHIKAGEIV